MTCLSCSLHWSLIVICYPGKVATFKGMNINWKAHFCHFFLVLLLFSEHVVLVQMVIWSFRLKFHVFYTWIHLKEIMLDSRISFKGKSISIGIVFATYAWLEHNSVYYWGIENWEMALQKFKYLSHECN